MEKSKRPIKLPTEETVVTMSERELVETVGKASIKLIHKYTDDTEVQMALISFIAELTAGIVSDIFGEDED